MILNQVYKIPMEMASEGRSRVSEESAVVSEPDDRVLREIRHRQAAMQYLNTVEAGQIVDVVV